MDFLMFLLIPLRVLLLGVILECLAFGFSYLLFNLLGQTSGLSKLSKMYPATKAPEGEVYKKQWMAVGRVFFKNTTDICINRSGLYVWIRSFLSKYQPALIPWCEFKEERKAVMAGQRAVRLTIGEPEVATIVVTQRLFEKLKPYLIEAAT